MPKYYSISYSAFGIDVHAALIDYYGSSNINIVSQSDTSVEFECPSITDVKIKLTRHAAGFTAYANDMIFSSTNSSFTSAKEYHLILADAFLLLDSIANNSLYSHSALIARLSNGRYICCGGITCGTNSDSLRATNVCFFTDTMIVRPIRFPGLDIDASVDGRPAIIAAYPVDNVEVERNVDGTTAYVPELYISAKKGNVFVGEDFYLSLAGLNGVTANGIYCDKQKYVYIKRETSV